MRTAVLLARGEVLEAVVIALAAAVVEGLALHGGHIEEVAQVHSTARALLHRKPADLGNLWYSKTCFLALLITLEVIGIALAASIVELLAFLCDGVVVIPLDFPSARSFVHLKQTHAFRQQRVYAVKRRENCE